MLPWKLILPKCRPHLLNTFQKLVIIGSSLTELHQLIHMTFIVDIYECKHYRLLLLSVIRPSIE